MKSASKQNYALDRSVTPMQGVSVAKIACVTKDHTVCVDFPGNKKKNLQARYVKSLNWNSLLIAAENQQEILLVFENGDAEKPIIIDILNTSAECLEESAEVAEEITKDEIKDQTKEGNSLNFVDEKTAQGDELQDVSIDGKRISFNAKDQIVLKCGESSITLTKAGKVIIKGAYLLNQSTGALRIKGGSVQLN